MYPVAAYLLKNVYTVKEVVNGVSYITPSFKQDQAAFGGYGQDSELALLWPQLFSDEAVKAAHPNTSNDYGRGIIALDILQKEVDYYYYSEEKHNFFVMEGFREAKEAGMDFIIMENLS